MLDCHANQGVASLVDHIHSLHADIINAITVVLLPEGGVAEEQHLLAHFHTDHDLAVATLGIEVSGELPASNPKRFLQDEAELLVSFRLRLDDVPVSPRKSFHASYVAGPACVGVLGRAALAHHELRGWHSRVRRPAEVHTSNEYHTACSDSGMESNERQSYSFAKLHSDIGTGHTMS